LHRGTGTIAAAVERFAAWHTKIVMSFTIKHFRDGAQVGAPEHAITMHAARFHARSRQASLQSTEAVILGERANGDETEIEVISFAH
jgi:hypothetical protein